MHESLDLLSTDFFFRYFINLFSLIVLLRLIYYRNDAQCESYSGFMIFGNGVFFVTALLHDVDMSMGFAFGLFAIFSMLRYRTETLSVRDMTYLFVLIAISLLSSVSSLLLLELITVNLILCLITWLSETSVLTRTVAHKIVVYENIELIVPSKREVLLSDLQTRLGLDVTDVEIGDVDFLRDSAILKVFYRSSSVRQTQK